MIKGTKLKQVQSSLEKMKTGETFGVFSSVSESSRFAQCSGKQLFLQHALCIKTEYLLLIF